MEKKYQVFVSSTYEDLKEERAAVAQCLLDIGCIPVGMEQFPASNMSQMDYIEKMLNECDYYILILAGRYGSVDVDSIGFTEKEYDYAISKGIPVMSFVIDDIGKLPNAKCESTEKLRAKLEAFRVKVCANMMVRFYKDIGSLQTSVVISLNQCIRDFPAKGWIRGDSVSSEKEVLDTVREYMERIIERDRKIPVYKGEFTKGKI